MIGEREFQLRTHAAIIMQFSAWMLGFLKFIVLAKLLGPSQYAAIGIAQIVIGTSAALSQTGARQFLIVDLAATGHTYDTWWTIEVAKGLTLALLVGTAAAILPMPVNSRMAVLAAAAAIAVTSFTSLYTVQHEKNIHLNIVAAAQLTGSLVGFLLSCCIAYFTRSLELVLASLVVTAIIQVLCSMAISESRHRLRIHRQDIWSKLMLSRWQLLSSIFSYLVVQADKIIVLFSLGSLLFAQYQISSVIASIPSLVLNQLIVNIGYPLLGKAHTAPEKFRLYLLFSLYLVAAISIPAVILTYFASGIFVSVVFGQKWAAAGTALPILFAANCLRPPMSVIEAAFWTSERFSWAPLMQAVRLVTFLLVVPFIVLEHELAAIAALVFISNLMALVASLYLLHRARIFALRIRILQMVPLLVPATLIVGLLYPFAARYAVVTNHVTLKNGAEAMMLMFAAGTLYLVTVWKLTQMLLPRIGAMLPRIRHQATAVK